MAHLLGAQHLHVALPERVLLDDITLGIDEGDRIGVVGRNGDGKSTLLRLLAQQRTPDEGRVTQRNGVRVGVLDQQDDASAGTTVRERVVGNRPEHEWASDHRIRDVMAGLLGGIPLETDMSDLSGGQVRRVHLAQLLVGDHDILLLDEPTNHLDVEGISWLAEHLRRRWNARTGGLVVVTHDRWFLDEVCTRMWEVHDGVVDPFEGGYAAFVLQRFERDRQAAASEARRQNLMRKELAWLRRGAPARTSKPKFRIDAANELISGEPPVRDTVALSQLATTRLGRDIIDLDDVTAGYDGVPVIADVTLSIGPADRIGVLGPNGAGKSTLLGLITGDLKPMSGRVKRGRTVTVRQVSQRLTGLADLLDEKVSDVIARYRTTFKAGKDEVSPGQLLERLGFTPAHQKVQIRRLSGGQQRRLDLLLTLLEEPNVLVLDEPTNDMDTDMLAAMEDLLDTWPGPLIVVSHDRYLLERVTDLQYAVLGGHVRHLPGGIEEYLRLGAAHEDRAAHAPAAEATDTVRPPASSGLTAAEDHAARKELNAVERKLAKLDERTKRIHARMAEHDPGDFEGLTSLTAELQAAQAQTAELEERWLVLSEIAG